MKRMFGVHLIVELMLMILTAGIIIAVFISLAKISYFILGMIQETATAGSFPL